MARTVNTVVRRPNGEPWASVEVYFTLQPGSFTAEDQYPQSMVRCVTGAQGELSVDLWVNEEGGVSSSYLCTLPGGDSFSFTLSQGDGSPVELSLLREVGVTEADAQYPALLSYVDAALAPVDAAVASASAAATAATAAADEANAAVALLEDTVATVEGAVEATESANAAAAAATAAASLASTAASAADTATATVEGAVSAATAATEDATTAKVAADAAAAEALAAAQSATVQLSSTLLIRYKRASVSTNVLPPGFPIGYGCILDAVALFVGTAPVGSALTVLVKRAGSTLATVVVADGSSVGSVSGLGIALEPMDLLTFDITTVGSTYPGGDLVLLLTGGG